MMDIKWFEILVQVAGVLVAVIGGFGAVPIVNSLKGAMSLKGNGALALTIVFAAVWGVAEMIVGGQITTNSFTVANIAALVVTVFTVSQAKYNMIKDSETPA